MAENNGQIESDNELEEEVEEEITYFEESSESEPELECDIWDNDSKILSNITPLKHITGCHLMPTCNKSIHLIKKPKLYPNIRPELTALIPNLQKAWKENTPLTNNDLELLTSPFKLCVIHDLLGDRKWLDDLRQELYGLYFNLRNMDLYEFFQSKDLKYLLNTSDLVKTFDEFLNYDIMELVAAVTGYEFTHISATCSLYSNTDYLLVHDDQREDRMVAFILYITDEFGWEKSDGGALQLFSKDSNGQPGDVVRELLPVTNQLVFFTVTNDSYHQVAELTSLSKYRLSINGWFHIKSPPVFDVPIYQPLINSLYADAYVTSKNVDIDLDEWINEDYLNPKSIELIQKHVEENSEISLKNFFKTESFKEILRNLRDNDVIWQKIGPINRFLYEIANLTKLPHVIERLLDLFQSTQMFQLLQKYTDLELTDRKARMKFELQRWTPGNYALLTEYNWKSQNELDLIIYFGCVSNSDVIGARTHYVTIDDEIQNALITIEPEENNLNIVYRDSARFTKYFSRQSKCQCFYVLMCSYAE